MKAIFLTEKEALEFIKNEYGESATLRNASVSDVEGFDVDEIPFAWSGETQAYEVNGGEAYVGFWETKDASYTITFNGIIEHSDSLYRAREIAEEIKDFAENCNAVGTISISDADGIIEEIVVELYLDDEPECDTAHFIKTWNRYSIGNTIRKARNAKGLTVRELAEAAGMSKNNLERIEGGIYNYTIDNLTAIAAALGISLVLN